MRREPVLASVVIPTFNRARRLELTLASFVNQTDPRYEIVLVDDGGSDDTPAVAARYAGRLRLKLVRQPNRGRSAARNAGVQEAAGDLLIFCDDDCIASPRFVAEHLAELTEDGEPRVVLGWQEGIVSMAEPDAALITPEMVLGDFAAAVRDFATPEPFWHQYVEPVIAAHGEDLEGFAIPWALGFTGNLSAPRRLVVDAGGFDERFEGWGLEDNDLHLRLCAAGARTRIRRAARNYHQAHPQPEERLAQWVRNAGYFLDKHDSFEVSAFVAGVFAKLPLAAISEIVQEHRRAGPSVLARELARVTREHARLLVRAAL
ncbi:MAG TPA: glycosyltransferase family 2 protein [Solirubrobacterales bacterium]|jgi:glycosyltransferase involved in cell wall biosynthesis